MFWNSSSRTMEFLLSEFNMVTTLYVNQPWSMHEMNNFIPTF